MYNIYAIPFNNFEQKNIINANINYGWKNIMNFSLLNILKLVNFYLYDARVLYYIITKKFSA